MANDIAVSVKGLKKSFKNVSVLNGVEFDVQKGSIFALLGANGSGKTSLLRCILGQYPHSGTVTWQGREIQPGQRLVYPVFDDCPFYLNGSGALNLRLLGFRNTIASTSYLDAGTLRRPVRVYSLGQRKALALTAALGSGAELLLLDEPTTGLDRDGMNRLKRDLRAVAAQCAILATGHHLEFYDDVSERVLVLKEGLLTTVEREDWAERGGAGLVELYERRCASVQD